MLAATFAVHGIFESCVLGKPTAVIMITITAADKTVIVFLRAANQGCILCSGHGLRTRAVNLFGVYSSVLVALYFSNVWL